MLLRHIVCCILVGALWGTTNVFLRKGAGQKPVIDLQMRNNVTAVAWMLMIDCARNAFGWLTGTIRS